LYRDAVAFCCKQRCMYIYVWHDAWLLVPAALIDYHTFIQGR